ncbi:AAA family ATPase [Chryseobacterium defluvii]|uniref:AAA domain-containing protein n=1 Tax=Chryseobacterium defluvii TaxID=160396 RepID=A0A495SCS3_9FLAO|nr:AAA family ATPase [Chryseobacterium defluvii]RKS97977.1 AAA domain-containing protein [Chryseobacterium defluvii]
MNNIDQSLLMFENVKNNIDNFIKSDNNESDTRSKIIDNYLINILGWSESDIKREGKLESGYFDYKVSCPSISFVIEAKRNHKEFILPSSHTKVKIKSILRENNDVIQQIRNYCVDIGLPYGVITNGKQFIISKFFNTNGSDWKENICLIFHSIEDIENRFVEFYENLSKYSLINNGGFKYDYIPIDLEAKSILSTLIQRDKEIDRNNLSSELSPIIDKFFGEIFSTEQEDDLNFIKECFVENIESKKNRDEIERLFADKAPQMANVVKAINTNSIVSQIVEEISDDQINIKSPKSPKPIIIIGTKGAGKTTFINHLFRTRDNEFSENHLTVYIDFREFYEAYKSFEPTNISKEIYEKLTDKYSELELHSLKALKRIYQKQIKQNDESIWMFVKDKDEDTYNRLLTEYLSENLKDYSKHLEYLNNYLIRERRKRMIVIIDNADQYSILIQEKIFLFSHSLSRNSNCGVIFSLREGYYYKWRNRPPFDAYESNVYHITAPKYSEVLLKRINYTLEHLNNFEGKASSVTSRGIKIEMPNQKVIEFLSGLKDSLFSDYNSDLINYLSFTTYPNIREGLRVFKQFLISGHTDVSNYILREVYKEVDRVNKQIIPIHEFVKSLGLQNKLYYNSEFSIVNNIFIPPKDSNDHFINYYILKKFYDIYETKGIANKYISFSEIIEIFKEIGYRTNIIISSIERLLDYNLLESDELITDIEFGNLDAEIDLCISSKGYYYYKELIKRFHYIDLVLQDTPIFSQEYFSKIKSVFPLSDNKGLRDLKARVETVKEFVNYLNKEENRQAVGVFNMFGKPLDYINEQLNADILRIESKL